MSSTLLFTHGNIGIALETYRSVCSKIYQIDPDNLMIYIFATETYRKDEDRHRRILVSEGTKTAAGIREVPVPRVAGELLQWILA